jgi:VanZ family protein
MFYGCAATILVLSLLPQASQPNMGSDKANHILAFGVLGLIGAGCWPGRLRVLAVSLMLYGLGIEIAQTFTPDRTADIEDVVANAAGVLLAYAITEVARRLRRA